MESRAVQLMKSHFDALSQTIPEEGVEFWFARDLMEPLGYLRSEAALATDWQVKNDSPPFGSNPTKSNQSSRRLEPNIAQVNS